MIITLKIFAWDERENQTEGSWIGLEWNCLLIGLAWVVNCIGKSKVVKWYDGMKKKMSVEKKYVRENVEHSFISLNEIENERDWCIWVLVILVLLEN